MRVASLSIRAVKSVAASPELELGPITLLVGRNNSGKSTVLRALHALQATGVVSADMIRFGETSALIKLVMRDVDLRHWGHENAAPAVQEAALEIAVHRNGSYSCSATLSDGQALGLNPIAAVEPHHFVVPYLSSRKVTAFDETINASRSTEIRTDLANLAAKVDRLMDVNHPRHHEFRSAVTEIIGLPLSAIPSPNGKQVGVWVNDTEWIRLEQMGDGVGQMLGLITQLCVGRGKLFLIEELENDIHPEGLKALLRLIEDKSQENQFVVSTHNNVVLRHLGAAAGSLLYEVTSEIVDEGGNRLPTTSISAVDSSSADRTRLLVSLGYELSDFEMFDGWLILEESSAERIIRDHLVRWFAPGLTRVRTVAANGTGDVSRTFLALHKTVLFTHLQDRYRGRVLVLVDGDATGLAAVEQLQRAYPDWSDAAFAALTQPHFEAYYPADFNERAAEILSLKDASVRREGKRQLLVDVLAWIEANEDAAREGFMESAAEVITHLQNLEAALLPIKQLSAD